jgi:hypothetical protein
MGPTRKRDLAGAIVLMTVIGYVAVRLLYQWFPPLTIWTGVSLLVVAAVEAGWAVKVRSKINAGEIGVGTGRLHPLAVARSVMVAKASAWVGAVVLGWWLGALGHLVPRHHVEQSAHDTPGAVVAAVSALALTLAALWLQHCCRSPAEPPETPDGRDAPEHC